MLVATGLLRLRISAANCARNKVVLQEFVSKRGHLGAAHVASIVLYSSKEFALYFQDHQIPPASKINLKGVTGQSPKRNLQIGVGCAIRELRLWGCHTRISKRFSVISSSPTIRLQATVLSGVQYPPPVEDPLD